MSQFIPGAQFMRTLADFVKKRLPKGWGFALIVFPFSRPGISNYISNAERASMIQALEETAKRLKNKGDIQTPEEN